MSTQNYRKIVEVRCDDVLQDGMWTDQARKYIKKRKLFDVFLEADQVFEKYQYPCTLAVVADGIYSNMPWVDYIKKNIHRYNIELHGSRHYNYQAIGEKDGERELRFAKEKIEDTFGQEVTTWYITFSRHKAPEWAERVCQKLNLKFPVFRRKIDAYIWLKKYNRLGYSPFPQVNFHYWVPEQVEETNQLIETICNS